MRRATKIMKICKMLGAATVLIALVTASPEPVIRNEWVKAGAHVISVGATRPTQREMDPALVKRSRLFVDSRAAAVKESGDVILSGAAIYAAERVWARNAWSGRSA